MPDFDPRHVKSPISELPAPAAYRQSTPAVLPLPTERAEYHEGYRRRWLIGIGIVVALHVVVGLVYWMTPKLRLKYNPPPEQWVQVSAVEPGAGVTPHAETDKPAGSPRDSNDH